MTSSQRLTNAQLAKQYFTVAAQSSSSWDTYITIQNRLAACPIDIAAEYEKNGSLKDFKVPGIGAKTKATLESILEKGILAARDTHVAKKDAATQQKHFGQSRLGRTPDANYEDRGVEQDQARTTAHKAHEERQSG